MRLIYAKIYYALADISHICRDKQEDAKMQLTWFLEMP